MNLANQKSGFIFVATILFVALAGAPHANAITGTERQITNNPAIQLWPAIYGDKIVWVDVQNDLYLYTISTGEQRRLTTSGFYKRNLQMHGDIITWFDGSGGFYLYDIKKGEEKSFANESIRPDPWGVGIYDNKMVFSATSPEGGDKDIFLYDITTGTTTRITSDPTPELTPAIYGSQVVFLNATPWWHADSQKAGVYVYDIETQQLSKIYSGPTSNTLVEIYGNTIAWVDGPFRYLHIYDLETKTDTIVNTIGAPSFGYLSIFRDKIVWVGTDLLSNKNAIYLYDITTGEQSRISSDTAEPWGYDGQDIHEGGVVWSDSRSGTTRDIYLYQFASQNQPPTVVSVQQTDDSAVSLSPAPYWKQTLGNGLDFSPKDLSIRVSYPGTGPYVGTLYGFTTSDYASGYGVTPIEQYSFTYAGSPTSDGKITLTASLPTSLFPLNPNRYYELSLYGPASPFSIYGSTRDNYPNGKAYYSFSSYPCGPYPYFNPEEVCEPGANNGIADIFFQFGTAAETLSGKESAITTEITRQGGAVVDGDIIAWMDNAGSGSPGDIYVYEISTGRKIRVTDDNTVKYDFMMGGRKILWTTWANNSQWDKATFIYDLNTGITTDITEKIGTRKFISDFDGQRIVLQTPYYESILGIYLYDISTSQLTLIDQGSSVTNPKISGDKILYQLYQGDNNLCGSGHWGPKHGLRLYDIASGEKQDILTCYGFIYDYAIDGDNIVVVYFGPMSPKNIFRHKISTNETTLISSPFQQIAGIDISGNLVVWSDTYDIFIYDIVTSLKGRTGMAPGASLHPKISGNTVVWDDYRAVTSESANIDIYMYQIEPSASENQPPVASFTFYPKNPKAGEIITFDASASSDSDGQIVLYEWDWDGDGEYDDNSTSAVITFWWPLGWDADTGGIHTVGLRVTDDDGSETIFSQNVIVQSSPMSQSNAVLMAGLWGFDWGNALESFKNWWNGDHVDFTKIDNRLRDYDGDGKPDTAIPLDWLRETEFEGIVKENDIIGILNNDIDPQQVSGLTYKTYLLNALYEEEQVNQAFANPLPTYPIDILADLAFSGIASLPDETIREGSLHILDLVTGIPLTIGGTVLHHFFKMADLFETFQAVDQHIYNEALGAYFLFCLFEPLPPATCENGWIQHVASVVPDEQEPETKAYFEQLFQKYWDKGRPYGGLEAAFKAQNTATYKQFVLDALEKHRDELPDRQVVTPQSPVELRVYDIQGNISGFIGGVQIQNIPNSVLDPNHESVEIFYPEGNYSYTVVGMESGTYGLEVQSLEDGFVNVFTASNITTSPGAVHQYTIDWDVLSQGEKGVTLQIDSDGDGVFEQTIKADATLQPPTADINGPYAGNEGSPIFFDASSSSDPDGEIILYEWDFDGDGIYDVASASSAITRAWGDDYQGEIILRVTDDEGLTDIATTTVNVNNVAPIISNLSVEGPTHPNQEIWTGDTLNFSGDFADAGWLDTHIAEWDFGNGANAIGVINQENNPPATIGQVTGNYIYYNAGTYTITLAVTDDDGGASTDTLRAVVKSIPAVIDCNPDTLNLKSNGKWITCYIELPVGYDVWQIDGSTVFLNGVIPIYLGKEGWAKPESNKSNIMDHDEDGILERMVKFNKEVVQGILKPEEATILTATGKIFYNQDLADFEGQDTIRVIEKGKN